MANTRSKSAFPIFDDGDVELRLTRKPEDRYVLHSVVLGLHSHFFKASLSRQWTPSGSETTVESGTKWTYELQFEPGTSVGIFVKVENTAVIDSVNANITADTATIYLNKTPWAPTEDDLTASRLRIVEAHRHFLSILYHQPPNLPTEDFKSALTLIVNIVSTADEYCALPAVSWFIENHLVRHFEADTVTFCIEHPHPALQLALPIRSSRIFKEAASRLVGAPSFDDAAITAQFADLGLVSWLMNKRTQLRATMREIDIKLLTLQIRNVSASKDVNIQVAIALFRDLVVGFYNEDHRWEDHRAKRSGWATYAKFYRSVGRFNESWGQADSLALLEDSGFAAVVLPIQANGQVSIRAMAPRLQSRHTSEAVNNQAAGEASTSRSTLLKVDTPDSNDDNGDLNTDRPNDNIEDVKAATICNQAVLDLQRACLLHIQQEVEYDNNERELEALNVRLQEGPAIALNPEVQH